MLCNPLLIIGLRPCAWRQRPSRPGPRCGTDRDAWYARLYQRGRVRSALFRRVRFRCALPELDFSICNWIIILYLFVKSYLHLRPYFSGHLFRSKAILMGSNSILFLLCKQNMPIFHACSQKIKETTKRSTHCC